MPRFIDLSVSIDNNEHSDHPGGSRKVTYRNHAETASGLAHFRVYGSICLTARLGGRDNYPIDP